MLVCIIEKKERVEDGQEKRARRWCDVKVGLLAIARQRSLANVARVNEIPVKEYSGRKQKDAEHRLEHGERNSCGVMRVGVERSSMKRADHSRDGAPSRPFRHLCSGGKTTG
jgi:hypothetical protein